MVLEDLAATFGMRSKEVIEKVTALEAEGVLTGVVDDRGKFICITPEEMDKVRDSQTTDSTMHACGAFTTLDSTGCRFCSVARTRVSG